LRSELTESEVQKFFFKVVSFFENQEIEAIAQGQQERSLTKNQIGPALKEFVLQIGIPQIVVRYDGHNPVRPLLRHGMTFLPDAQASLGAQKILAIEVKILRDSDPSGSLSKAIGQTFMYRALGFEMSLGLIFDYRSKRHGGLENPLSEIDQIDNRVKFILFNAS
jgi:hypothetical protein